MMSLGCQRRWYGVKKDCLLRSGPKAQGVKGHPKSSCRGQGKGAREVSLDRISLVLTIVRSLFGLGLCSLLSRQLFFFFLKVSLKTILKTPSD